MLWIFMWLCVVAVSFVLSVIQQKLMGKTFQRISLTLANNHCMNVLPRKKYLHKLKLMTTNMKPAKCHIEMLKYISHDMRLSPRMRRLMQCWHKFHFSLFFVLFIASNPKIGSFRKCVAFLDAKAKQID